VSIRTRLAIAVALVLVGTFVLSGIVLVRSTRVTLVEQVDQTVRDNAERSQGKNKPPHNTPSGGGGGQSAERGALLLSAPPAYVDDAYHVVAQLVFNPDGTQQSAEPCGFESDPKPLPKVPPIPSSEIESLITHNRIITTPSVDGSLNYRMLVDRQWNGDIVVTD
jgi:hypothetical protein